VAGDNLCPALCFGVDERLRDNYIYVPARAQFIDVA